MFYICYYNNSYRKALPIGKKYNVASLAGYKKMKIAICEDNKQTAAMVEQFILELSFKHVSCDVFYDGKDLIKYLEKEAGYLIYMLDIQMPKWNGLKTASFIRKKDKNAIIVFMTDYKEYVYDVFEVLPFRFLIKPIERDRLQEIISDAFDYLNIVNKYITFSIEKEEYQIPYEDILYLESNKRKIHLHTASKEYVFYGKLANLENLADHNIFVRIHVSFLVHMGHIKRIAKEEIELDNGVILPVSKKYRDTLRKSQINFVKWRNGI